MGVDAHFAGGRGVLPQLHRLPGRGQPGRLRPHILSRSQSKSASGLGGQLCSFGRALVRLRSSSFLPGGLHPPRVPLYALGNYRQLCIPGTVRVSGRTRDAPHLRSAGAVGWKEWPARGQGGGGDKGGRNRKRRS